jgi:hypothetical protein
MALIIPPGFAAVTHPMKHSASPREATICYGIQLAVGVTVAPALANQLNDLLDTHLGAIFASEVTFGPTVLHVGQDGGESLVVEGNTTQQGSSVSEKPPSQVAGLVRKTTSRGGRRGRGRMYLPWFVHDSEVSEVGIIGSTWVASVNTNLAAWLAGIAALADVVDMELLHSPGVSPTGGPNPVTGLTLDPLIATQRRRLGR